MTRFTRTWLTVCAVTLASLSYSQNLIGKTSSMKFNGTAQATTVTDFVQNELLVKFRAGTRAMAGAANRTIGATEVNYMPQIGWSKVRLPAGTSVSQALIYYRGLPEVEYAEPNYMARGFFTPNDPLFAQQYGPKKVQADKAWDITQGSSSITVAIIDTGVDLTHPDLAAKIVPGWDFVNGDNTAQDDQGHGTHCAGIAAAITNNGVGGVGIAPNVKIMPIKVLASSGGGTYEWIISGIMYGADNGAKVLSMSLGGGAPSQAMLDALVYAKGKNVTLVAAAGNGGDTTANYPAFYNECIAVANTDANDQRWGSSTYGNWVDVAAPGHNILSTTLGGGYGPNTGTSMSCPLVAGQAALLRSYMTTPTVDSVRARIEQNCDPVGNFVIHGRVNVLKSLPAQPGGNTIVRVQPGTITAVEGTVVGGALPQVLASDNTNYSLRSVMVNQTGHVASSSATFTIPNSVQNFSSMFLEFEGRSVSGASSLIYIWNWNANRWDYNIAVPMLATDKLNTVAIRVSSMTPYLNSSRQVRLRIREILPVGRGRNPYQHVFHTDKLGLAFQ